jgi:DNA gyrase subunit B
MLNVEKARADKVYGNDKLNPVIVALGAGIGDEFDLNKLRYHKIIIMADADVDGAHIRTLLLTFFFRFMRPLIEQGYVYSAVPPLYKLTRGKQQRVAYSDEERDRVSAEMRGDAQNVKIDISPLQGPGRNEPPRAVGDHHGPGKAHAAPHHAGGRREGGRDLHHPHGRAG